MRAGFRILGNKSSMSSEGIGLHQSGALLPIMFVIFMEKIFRHSQGIVSFGHLRIASLLFAVEVRCRDGVKLSK